MKAGFAAAAVVAACLGSSCGEALGQQVDYYHSANYFMPACRDFAFDGNNTSAFLRGQCVGMVHALLFSTEANGLVCTGRVTNEQMVRVVVQYIDQQPARIHESFMLLALEALAGVWPCKK